MLRAFGWTALFWSLFTFVNGVSDAILFYSVFPWYQDMTAWHWLKAAWILFAVLTGAFAMDLWYDVTKYGEKISKSRLKRLAVFGFLLLWFCFLRWIFHEEFMGIWRMP